MRLPELQLVFKQHVLGQVSPVAAQVKDKGISVNARLSVYYNNVVGSLIDVLMDTYPAVAKLVGEPFFRSMAKGYVTLQPPTVPVMFRYGESFAEYIASYSPAAPLPYLADVARLEWAWNNAYNAVNDSALEFTPLVNIHEEDYDRLRFLFRASVGFVESVYPVDKIWDRCVNNPQNEEALDISSGAVSLMLWRPDIDVQMLALPNSEYLFCQSLAKGNTLEEACMAASSEGGDFELAACLSKHFELGSFASVT